MTTLPPGHRLRSARVTAKRLKNKTSEGRGFVELHGAGNETRTRDPDLGKVVLYQLSYSRIGVRNNNRTDAFVKTLHSTFVLKTADFQATTVPRNDEAPG